MIYIYIASNDIRHNYVRLQNWSIGKLEKVVDGWTLQLLEAIAAIDVDCHPELCCVRTTRFIISLSPWTSRSHSLTFSSSGGGEGGGGEAWGERSSSSPSRFRKETLEVSLLPRDITLHRPSGGGESTRAGTLLLMSHPKRGFLGRKWGTYHFWEIHICGAAPLSINAISPFCEGLVAARITLCAVVNTYHPNIP